MKILIVGPTDKRVETLTELLSDHELVVAVWDSRPQHKMRVRLVNRKLPFTATPPSPYRLALEHDVDAVVLDLGSDQARPARTIGFQFYPLKEKLGSRLFFLNAHDTTTVTLGEFVDVQNLPTLLYDQDNGKLEVEAPAV
ncbi:MAG TPA: hypothetical protein VJG85_00280 [Patescibacteria group bacterium]|nr:hypothetical protein [Patescibacteria group bacterium]